MVLHGQNSRSRHNVRHTHTLASLMGLGAEPTVPPPSEEMLREALRRWGVPEDDPNVQEVVRRLSRAWKKWSDDTRRILLLTADAIAHVETVRSISPSKAQRDRTLRLARSVVAAARLSTEVQTMFPAPWHGEREWLANLNHCLADYIRSSMTAIVDSDRASAAFVARAQVKRLIEATTREESRNYWEVLALVVWIAGGMAGKPRRESTMRRWIRSRPHPGPERHILNRHWGAIVKATKREVDLPDIAFQAEASTFLTGEGGHDTHPQKSRQ